MPFDAPLSQAESAILSLLDERGDGKSICPSEAARSLAGPEEEWRDRMEDIHAAVDTMLTAAVISISWKGSRLSQRRGAYRITRRSPKDQIGDVP